MWPLECPQTNRQTDERPLEERYFAKLLLSGNDLDAVADVGHTKCTLTRTHEFVDSAMKAARMGTK